LLDAILVLMLSPNAWWSSFPLSF